MGDEYKIKQFQGRGGLLTVEEYKQELGAAMARYLKRSGPAMRQSESTELYKETIGRVGRCYPANLLLTGFGETTKYGWLNPEHRADNLKWAETLKDALLQKRGWEVAERKILEEFEGYGLLARRTGESEPFVKRIYLEGIVDELTSSPGFAVAKALKTAQGASGRRIRLSRHQRAAIAELKTAYDAFSENLELGGYKPRPPLVVGPSGVGKTTIIRALAKMAGLPMMLAEPSNWILRGAYTKPYTLDVIGDFVAQHDEGIIAIDECDKFGAEGGQDWWRSVRGEAMALIEKKTEALAWGQELKRKLQERFFVVGMGTWQAFFRRVTRNTMDEDCRHVNFHELMAEDSIPEELLARFGNPILLQPPSREDFEEGIKHIHIQLKSSPSKAEMDTLVDDAVESGKNARWLEDYATAQLFKTLPRWAVPEEVGPKEPAEDTPEDEKHGQAEPADLWDTPERAKPPEVPEAPDCPEIDPKVLITKILERQQAELKETEQEPRPEEPETMRVARKIIRQGLLKLPYTLPVLKCGKPMDGWPNPPQRDRKDQTKKPAKSRGPK